MFSKKSTLLTALVVLMFSFLLGIGVLVGISLFQERSVMMDERKILLRTVLESNLSYVRHMYEESQLGHLSVEEAQARAKDGIRNIRYGSDGYVFALDRKGYTVAHGIYPQDEGTPRIEHKDAFGVTYIKNIVETAINGGGYSFYHYIKPKSQDNDPHPKMVYSRLFDHWGWVLATGAYTDDIDEAYYKSLKEWLVIIIPPLIVFMLITLWLSNKISESIAHLKAERELAQSATKAKSDFLANMSHEIRTPLNGTMGMLTLVLGTKLTHQQREWTQIAYQSSEELLNLINDILDLSKVEAGHMILEDIPFDLQENIKAVTDLLYPRAHRKGVEILVDLQPSVPAWVVGDPVRMRQILINLIGNAIKFTSEGYILLTIDTIDDESSHLMRFEVKDTGIGIPEDKQAYIFEKFSQAEESTTRNFGGTGLGLAICRKLTALMGGNVGVRSKMGQGSTFWFTVRFKKSTTTNNLIPASFISRKISCLVFHPHQMIGDILLSVLKGVCVSTEFLCGTTGVQSAIQQAVSLQRPFDFVFIDIDYFGNSPANLSIGIDAIRNISPKTHIVLISSPDRPLNLDEVNLSRHVGIVTKPILPVDVYSAMDSLLRNENKGKASFLMGRQNIKDFGSFDEDDNDADENVASQKNILIAEDQVVNQMLMRTMIAQMGYAVDVAKNGLEAVRMAAEKEYDMILMDGHMPEMDGLEATKQIRVLEANTGRHTPIIALTADAMVGDRDKCLEAGMDDYMQKPVKVANVKDMLVKYAGMKKD